MPTYPGLQGGLDYNTSIRYDLDHSSKFVTSLYNTISVCNIRLQVTSHIYFDMS